MMAPIKMLLTKKQTELLKPLFGLVEKDQSCMLVGQFFEAKDGEGFFVVAHVGADTAIELQKAMGTKAGTMTPTLHEVFTEVD
jgi:hypothetical protein